jgi:hypothetical protein
MNAMASRAICPTVSGVFPDEPPTPVLSNVTTPPAGRQRVDQRRIPAVEVPAEMLQQDKRHPAVSRLAVRVVDAVRGADELVREPCIRHFHSGPAAPSMLDQWLDLRAEIASGGDADNSRPAGCVVSGPLAGKVA